MSFLEFDASDKLFVYAKKMGEFVKDDATIFMRLDSMKDGRKVASYQWCVIFQKSL